MEEDAVLFGKAQECFRAGRREEAVALATSRRSRDLHDAAAHLRWAALLEDLDLMDDLIYEINLAIRDDPATPDPYVRLAEIYLDQGQPQRAVRVWAQLVSMTPDEPEYYRQWGEALEETGDYEKARAAYELGQEKTGDPRFAGLLKNLQFMDRQEPQEEQATPAATLLPQPHQLATFVSLFGGREGVHARQWISPTGETG